MSEHIFILEKAPDKTLWADLPDMPLVVACGENMPTLELNLRTAMDSWLAGFEGEKNQPMTRGQAEMVVRGRAKEMGVDPSHFEIHIISNENQAIQFNLPEQGDALFSQASSSRRSFMKKVFL